MTKHRFPLLLAILPSLFAIVFPGARTIGNTANTLKDAIIVSMEDCEASRQGKITASTSILRLLFAGPPEEELVKRGVVEVDGHKLTLYLPETTPYSTKNSKLRDDEFENTSTLISIDQNGDGHLTDDEGWYANMPLRLGDRMFSVTEIAADGSRMVLAPSKSRLRGVVVGRRCPPFSFKTADGEEVSRESLAGKPFFLDIWSIT
jgi:hypothetical protein